MNNAHHFGIGTFINNLHPPDPHSAATDILREARAAEATHTSKTASYAPKCNPGTRIEITEDIMDWVGGARNDKKPTSILWFSGPAGGGKTCIMREVVNRCDEADILVASYFFSSRVPECDREGPFVATIVHQLTVHSVLKPLILDAIVQNRAIFDESLDLQMKKLIIEPLQSSIFLRNPYNSKLKLVIAIDGFDECRNHSERHHLLQLLRTLIIKLPESIIIILASRPELDLRMAFRSRQFEVTTRVLRLQDYDGTEDTRIFFCDEFEKIRETHPMRRSIPKGWPVEVIVNILIDKSSGLFILPATLMKHVKNPRRNPVELLDEVLALSDARSPPASVNPLAEIDSLYTLILHPPKTDVPLMKRILHCLLGMGATTEEASKYCSPSFLDQFMFLSAGKTDMTLCDLHSVLSVPSPDCRDKTQPIYFHHKSLQDFLISPDRSSDLYQAPHKTHLDLIVLCCRHLQAWADAPGSVMTESTIYAANYWTSNLKLCFEDNPKLVPLHPLVLEFDPRIIWRYDFVREFDFVNMKLTREVLHSSMCGDRSCLPLCRRLARMDECSQRVEHFSKTFGSGSRRERIEALPQFDLVTGLSGSRKSGSTPSLAKISQSPVYNTPAPSSSSSAWRRLLSRPKRWFGG